MEEEVTELLGREKSERRSTVDSAEGYRNGYGKPRRLAMSSGTITLRRPRVRGVEERFESRVLPLFARRTKELGALLPELYLHGLAEGDFELAMRGLLGEGAPLSKSSIRRLRAGWTAEFEEWSQRRLEGREVVYCMGGRDLSEGRARARQGGAAGGARCDARRDEGGVGPAIGLPRVGRVLVRGVAGSEGTRHRGAPASDGRTVTRRSGAQYGRYGLRRASNGAGTTR